MHIARACCIRQRSGRTSAAAAPDGAPRGPDSRQADVVTFGAGPLLITACPGAGKTRDKLFSGALALPEGLERLFNESGLERVQRGSLTIRMDYANFDDYWEPLLGGQGPVGTYVAGLDPDVRRRIEAGVRAAYLSGAPDGMRSLTATAWAVRGIVA